MKEQSAIDFLHSKILFNIGLDDNDIFKLRELVKIAKKLEEKQHGKTWDSALDKYEVRAGNYMRAYEDFDDYFDETYGSKGSDEHIVDTTEMIEISDEKIEKAARDYDDAVIYGPPLLHFEQGAFWYREKLKSGASQEK